MILAPPTAQSHDSAALIFPLVFLNDGNGSGVIESLSIKIEGNNSIKLYAPIAEIDFGKYIIEKRKLHTESMIGTFGPFPLHGKESIQKHILFSQEENSEKYPLNKWQVDSYKFRIFIKHSHQKKPIEYVHFKRFISKKVLDEYKAGTGFIMRAAILIPVVVFPMPAIVSVWALISFPNSILAFVNAAWPISQHASPSICHFLRNVPMASYTGVAQGMIFPLKR